jgi:DNA-binding transcriptional regulator YdaS (Cro superfamily)
MKETIYTQTLKRAADAEGGSAALAGLLHVPQNTLERWMSGRAQTPVRAFLKALERLTHHENTGAAAPLPAVNGEPLVFRMGQLLGRCQRCDGTEFVPVDPAAPVKLTSPLQCRACGASIVHGNLIAQLAQDAVLHAHAMTAARTRRQTGRQPVRKKPDVTS